MPTTPADFTLDLEQIVRQALGHAYPRCIAHEPPRPTGKARSTPVGVGHEELIGRMRIIMSNLLRRLGLMALATRVLNSYYAFLKWRCRRAGKDPISAVYGRTFFADETALTLPSGREVVRVLQSAFHPTSVLDVGCGTGVYLKFFSEEGVEVLGVDGSRHAREQALIPPDLIAVHDVTAPFNLGRMYDLVMCFEVGEHIPAQKESELVANLARHGHTIVFSAASPGQGGVDHINEQPPEHWISLFSRQGFQWDEAASRSIRANLQMSGAVWWLVANLIVLRKRS